MVRGTVARAAIPAAAAERDETAAQALPAELAVTAVRAVIAAPDGIAAAEQDETVAPGGFRALDATAADRLAGFRAAR